MTMEPISNPLLDELEEYANRIDQSEPDHVDINFHELRSVIARLRSAESEADRLNQIVNSPQSDDFLRAVSTEAEHQRQRWGSEHDSGKQPADWFWLVGYLAGKALHAHAVGDTVKAEHHVITTAAALANWHRAMFGNTNMRPGIDGDSAMERKI